MGMKFQYPFPQEKYCSHSHGISYVNFHSTASLGMTHCLQEMCIISKVATGKFNIRFDQIYSPNSSIFGCIPNISIWYSVSKRIYSVDQIYLVNGGIFIYTRLRLIGSRRDQVILTLLSGVKVLARLTGVNIH